MPYHTGLVIDIQDKQKRINFSFNKNRHPQRFILSGVMRAAFLLRPASIRDAMLIGDFHTPNAEPIAAIEEVREMCSHPKNCKSYKTVEECWKALHEADNTDATHL